MTSSNVIIAFYPYVSMSKKTHAAIVATVLIVTGIGVINAEGIYFGNAGREGQAGAGTLEETLEPARDRVETAETVQRIHDAGSGDVLLPYNGSPGALLVAGGMFGGVMAVVFARSRRGRYAAPGMG